MVMAMVILQHEAEDKWYDFDDRHVSHVSQDSIKSSAAYVLFYKKVHATTLSGTQSMP
ncbi:Ubiquitin carboxyl-terminal hydrolase 8 [Platanthera guangdongensis]|uniref:Ubiquitin carboxyl-terminal hydrolase 8 n=1 Tax=Platanthera guangdongensis TaxID=2320717 RepID=A0ABR2N091_9ASPA